MVANNCLYKSGKLTYKRMFKSIDNNEMYPYDYSYYSPRSGRIYLNGGYKCNNSGLNGRIYLNGRSGSFKDWAKKAANTLKNVAKKGYSVFKKVYNPVKKILKSDIVSDIIGSVHPGAKKAMDIALNVIDSAENAIDNKSIKPLQDNEYVQEGIEKGKEYLINKFKKDSSEKLDTIKQLSETPKSGILPKDYEFAKNILKMIDVNSLKKMKSNMTGGRLVKDLVNQLLIDKNQDLRCGRLMIDKRYRKIFNIKPFNIKNKLNKKTLKELFDNAPLRNAVLNPKIAVSNVDTKHSINMENTDSSNSSNSTNENSSGRMKNNINSQVGKNRNNRLNEVKNNDLYELLYGLK